MSKTARMLRNPLLVLSLFLAVVVFWQLKAQPAYSQSSVTLTVAHQLDAGGTVTSDVAGISCGSDCQESYAYDTTLTLTAAPAAGRAFYRWNVLGATCVGASGSFHTSPTCTLTTSYTNVTATAYWIYEQYNVTVQKTGSGSGTVTSSPAGINCGSDCSGSYSYPTDFTLTATPASDSTFAYWEASGADVCNESSKGSGSQTNPNPVCSDKTWNIYRQNYTAIARFEKKSGGSAAPAPSQSSPASAAAAPAKPEPPKLETTTISGQAVDSTTALTTPADKPLVLSGKTVPNGVVTLYIFSEPKTATTTADAEGNWSYAVADLPPGDHHVEVEVKDPATGQTSDRAKLLAFTVTAPAEATSQTADTSDQPQQSNRWPLFAGIGAVLLALISTAGWWFIRRHKARSPKIEQVDLPES